MRKNLHQKKDPLQKPGSVAKALVAGLRGKRKVDGFKAPTRFGS